MASPRTAARIVTRAVAAGGGAVLLAASPAAAHTGRGAGGLWDGLLHPITGTDHLLAMVAVGIVAVIAIPLGRAWLAPAAFLAGMLVGGVAGMIDLPLPGAETMILGSVLVLALAIAGSVRGVQGPWLLAPLAVAGLAHGHAHGAEAPTAAHPVVYVVGFLAATVALHVTGMGVGLAVRNRSALRVSVGAATFAAGALLVAG